MALRTNLTQCWPLTSNSLAGSEAGSALTASFAGGGAAAAYVAGAPGPCWQFGASSQFALDGVAPPTQFALAVWWWSAGSLSNGGTLASLTLADSHYYQMMAEPAGFVIKARSRAGGAIADASDPGNAVSSGWNLSVMLVDLTSGSENIRIWQNGTMSAPTAITTVPAGSGNKLGFGVIRRDSDGGFLDGLYTKYIALWSGGLPTDADLDAWYADPTAILGAPASPVLSSPTIVSTGNTIATVRVTTDTAPTGSSILAVQVLPAADATPTAAAILASPTQTITSGASGARDFNLTGLTNGTAYKAHFAQTGPSNVVSTASFTPSTVPGAPTIGTAVAGNAQATVNGTAPGSTGGSAITGYRSTATPGGSTVTGASLPITHTGLTNGAAYTFTLAAQNANGYGAESAASNSVTPSSGADVTPPTLGGSITIGTVTSSSIQASWSAGSDNVAVTSYEVSSNGGGSYSDVGNVLTYTFTGLAPSTSYALRVRAKDAAGNVSSALSATQSTGAAPSSITGTFTLPGTDDRTDKQEVTLHTVQALSSLTVDGNGATVNGAPASLAANGFFRLRFDAQSVAWYRVG